MLLALLFSLFWLFPLWFCEFAVQLYHASTVVFLNWNYKLFIEPKLVVFLFPTVWVSWHLHLQCLFSFLNRNCHHITSSSFFFFLFDSSPQRCYHWPTEIGHSGFVLFLFPKDCELLNSWSLMPVVFQVLAVDFQKHWHVFKLIKVNEDFYLSTYLYFKSFQACMGSLVLIQAIVAKLFEVVCTTPVVHMLWVENVCRWI